MTIDAPATLTHGPSRIEQLVIADSLLAAALRIVDELELPAEIGAHLDHGAQLLRRCMTPPGAAPA